MRCDIFGGLHLLLGSKWNIGGVGPLIIYCAAALGLKFGRISRMRWDGYWLLYYYMKWLSLVGGVFGVKAYEW